MGAVYEAEHIEIGKKVALKVLHPQFSRQADLVARFRREARAASKVGHPNIVDVTDSGTTEDGDAYFVMERLDGTDLADVLRNERIIAIDRTVGIGAQICRALQAAHQAGIIHRDLKPENIFLVARDGQPDFVKVLDFGIAKSDAMQSATPRRLTTPGVAMGTPEYMAPEQAAGQSVDARADIYSVGAILYEMLVGEPPHAGTSVMDILAKKATEAPQPLRPRNKNVPEALEHVILTALEREPAARQQTMAALEYELTKCMKGRGTAVAAVLGIKEDNNAWDEQSRSGFDRRRDDGERSAHDRFGHARTDAPGRAWAVVVGGRARGAARAGVEREWIGGTAARLIGSHAAAPDPRHHRERGDEQRAPDDRADEDAERVVARHRHRRGPRDPRWCGLLRVHGRATQDAGARRRDDAEDASAKTPPVAEKTPAELGRARRRPSRRSRSPKRRCPTSRSRSCSSGRERTAEGGRIIAPPGDNLKELLDRIEKASPGNADAAALRTRDRRRRSADAATLALKKQKPRRGGGLVPRARRVEARRRLGEGSARAHAPGARRSFAREEAQHGRDHGREPSARAVARRRDGPDRARRIVPRARQARASRGGVRARARAASRRQAREGRPRGRARAGAEASHREGRAEEGKRSSSHMERPSTPSSTSLPSRRRWPSSVGPTLLAEPARRARTVAARAPRVARSHRSKAWTTIVARQREIGEARALHDAAQPMPLEGVRDLEAGAAAQRERRRARARRAASTWRRRCVPARPCDATCRSHRADRAVTSPGARRCSRSSTSWPT